MNSCQQTSQGSAIWHAVMQDMHQYIVPWRVVTLMLTQMNKYRTGPLQLTEIPIRILFEDDLAASGCPATCLLDRTFCCVT